GRMRERANLVTGRKGGIGSTCRPGTPAGARKFQARTREESMRVPSSIKLGLLLAGTVSMLAFAARPVLAQPAPAASEPPPPWAQGRPSPQVKLAPVAPP